MAELKKCPFCGGEAKYIEGRYFLISKFVTCTKCGIETRRNYVRKNEAIEAWNNRATEFDEQKYKELVLAEMERKHTEQQQLLSELKSVIATESDIRAKAIDEFAEKAIKIVYEANNRRRNPQPRDMVADIHFKLMDLAEQLKEE